MARINHFPLNQNDTRGKKQAPAVKIADKQHRGKHHKMAPVINTTVYAASVFHNKTLERTEKQNTDVIAEEIEHREHQKIRFIHNTSQIKHSENRVKNKPDQHHNPASGILIFHKIQKLLRRIVRYFLVLLFFGMPSTAFRSGKYDEPSSP